jgi:phospholipid/cholesterol/gamma-HCH transport system substrate-binding protein
MAERRMKLRLGLFVAGSLAALAGLVVMFGGSPTIFTSRSNYTVVFPEAPGIAPGTPVRKSGVRIGEVTAIDLNPETGMVNVRIRVEPKNAPRSGEDAVLTRGLLTGDTAIDFIPHTDPGQVIIRGEPYPPGSEIRGLPPITTRSLLSPAQASIDRISNSFEKLEKIAPKVEMAAGEFGQLAHEMRQTIPDVRKTLIRVQNLLGALDQPDADPVTIRAAVGDLRELFLAARPFLEDARRMINRLEPEIVGASRSARQTFDSARTTTESINEILSPENRKQIAELLKNLNQVTFNIIKATAGLGTLLDEAEKTFKGLNRHIDTAGLVLADIRAITKPLAERADQLVKDVTDSAAQLNLVLRDVRDVARAFAREDGTLQKLLTDPDLYRNLDAATLALAKVLTRADRIAKDLEVFADKVARRPELIGVGGALRPSSGLKDAPIDSKTPCYRPEWPPSIPASRTGPPWLEPPNRSSTPPPVQGYPVR